MNGPALSSVHRTRPKPEWSHLTWGLLLLLMSGLTSGAEPPAPAAPESQVLDPFTVALIEAHNRERAKEKKAPLTYNAKLDAAAGVQARDMADHDRMTHEGSDGSTPAQRIERQGYHGRRSGENVAEGQQSVAEVMLGWMNSPHHRENILGDFSEIGVARAFAKDKTSYWCVDFGLAWPKLDPVRAAAEAVEAINRERAKANRPPLAAHALLEAEARRQATKMAGKETLGDKKANDEEGNPLQGVAEKGRFDRLGELAASGPTSPEELVKTWLGAEAQRESLLGDFNALGIGYAPSEKGTPYWVALLGRKPR